MHVVGARQAAAELSGANAQRPAWKISMMAVPALGQWHQEIGECWIIYGHILNP